MVRPIRDRLIIKRARPESERFGILLPQNAQEKESTGIVENIGPAVSNVKVGQEIVFYEIEGEEDAANFTIGEEDYTIVRESQVLAVFEEGSRVDGGEGTDHKETAAG